MAKDNFLERVLSAAKRHGEDSEADMEVGDLQMLAYAMWAKMTPAQRQALAKDEQLCDLIADWDPRGDAPRRPFATPSAATIKREVNAMLRGKRT